jgi:lipopolysaccharide transport system permease protein
VKFKQSLLGPAWLIFQPLALLGAFVVGFRHFAHVHSAGVPYAVFTLVGLTVWTYFQIAVTMAAASLISNYIILKRTPCPRLAFPIASLVTNLPALAVPLGASLGLAVVLGVVTARLAFFPVALVWLFVVTAATALLLSALSAWTRDVISFLPFAMQLGLFVSPIGYPLTSMSTALRSLLALNPLTGLIEFWRWTILSVHDVHFGVIAISAVVTCVLAVTAWTLFARTEAVVADII